MPNIKSTGNAYTKKAKTATGTAQITVIRSVLGSCATIRRIAFLTFTLTGFSKRMISGKIHCTVMNSTIAAADRI